MAYRKPTPYEVFCVYQHPHYDGTLSYTDRGWTLRMQWSKTYRTTTVFGVSEVFVPYTDGGPAEVDMVHRFAGMGAITPCTVGQGPAYHANPTTERILAKIQYFLEDLSRLRPSR